MNRCRIFFAVLLLAAAVSMSAQPRDRNDDRGNDRDRDRNRGARVIFYQNADFRGNALVVYAGDELPNLSGLNFEGGGPLNDRISSIRIEGAAEVYVYENAGFRGSVMRLTESARDLTGRLMPGTVSVSWNDRISSLRVETRRRDEPKVDPDVVIKRAYQDLLARDPDPAGLRNFRGMIIDQGWTELMVRDNIRRSDEFRLEGANRIIKRAYLDVLVREPDPSGLKHYRELLLDKNWTEGDVRDDLRRSDEFRKKNGGRDQPDDRRDKTGRP